MKRIIKEVERLQTALKEMRKRLSKVRCEFTRGKIDALLWVYELAPIELDPIDSVDRLVEGVKHICTLCGGKLKIGIGHKSGVVVITVKACEACKTRSTVRELAGKTEI